MSAAVTPSTDSAIERGLRLIALLTWLLAGITVIVSLAVWLTRGAPRMPVSFMGGPVGTTAVALAGVVYSTVAAYLVARGPRNPIGWIFMSIGLGLAFLLPVAIGLADAVRRYRLLEGPQLWLGWGLTSILLPAAGVGLAMVLLLFPTGRPEWRHWRLALASAGVGALLIIVGGALRPDGLIWYPTLPNPLDIPSSLGPLLGLITMLGTFLLVGGLGMAMAWLVGRGGRPDDGEQAQLAWVVLGGLIMGLTLTPLFVARYVTGVEAVLGERLVFVAALGGSAFPVMVAVACRREGMFGFRHVLGRSLVYLPLMALLAGLFSASAALLQKVFVTLTGTTSDAAVILATLLVVASLTPARQGLETVVKRATGEQTPVGGAAPVPFSAQACPAQRELIARLGYLEARLAELEQAPASRAGRSLPPDEPSLPTSGRGGPRLRSVPAAPVGALAIATDTLDMEPDLGAAGSLELTQT